MEREGKERAMDERDVDHTKTNTDANTHIPSSDPEGDFIEAIGRQHSPETAARIIKEHMGDWKGGVKKK